MKRNIVSAIVILYLFGITACKENVEDSFKIVTYNVWQGYMDGKHSRLPVDDNGQSGHEPGCSREQEDFAGVREYSPYGGVEHDSSAKWFESCSSD